MHGTVAAVIATAIRAVEIIDRAGGSSRTRSSSRSSSSRGSGSIGAIFGGLVFLAFVGVIGYFAYRRFKAKSPAQAAALAGGAAALLAAGTALAKKAKDEMDKGNNPFQGLASKIPGLSGVGGAGGIDAIKAHDPNFDQVAFLASTEKAFFIVQQAWTEQKPELSRQVMADGMWQQHKTQIDDMKAKGKRDQMDDLAITSARVASAGTSESKHTITVRFDAHCRDYEVDLKTGKASRRADKEDREWAENWTFQRSATATTKGAGEGTLNNKCPHCGAPLSVDLQGICKYCKTNIMAGDEDWVLARIDDAN